MTGSRIGPAWDGSRPTKQQDIAGWLVRIEVEQDDGLPPALAWCIAACRDDGEAIEAVRYAFSAPGVARSTVRRETIARLGLEPGQAYML